MTNKNSKIKFFYWLLCVLLVGCSAVKNTVTPTFNTLTITPTTESKDKLPPTKSPIIKPTLTDEIQVSEYFRIIEAVLPASGTRGTIIPGQTTVSQLEEGLLPENLLPLFIIEDGEYLIGSISESKGTNPYHPFYDYYVGFKSKNNTISEIEINLQSSLQAQWKLWEPYSIKNILINFGKPDEVWINPGFLQDPKRQLGTSFALLLVYRENHLIISYNGFSPLSRFEEVCPGRFKYDFDDKDEPGGVHQITMHVFDEDVDAFLKNRFSISPVTDIRDQTREYVDITKAANIELDEFYHMYAKGSTEQCFIVPECIRNEPVTGKPCEPVNG